MAEAGDDDRDAVAVPGPAFFHDERVETYDGENEDLDQLAAMVVPPQNPASLEQVLEQGLVAAEPLPQVHQYAPELGPEDLQACLRQGGWDRSYEILDLMVQHGRAAAGAVQGQGIDPLDMRMAHPELVLLLQGHAYWDIKTQEGGATRAEAYYTNNINMVYPNGTTGSSFADKLLRSIREPSGDNFKLKENTHGCIMDYLKIYFPEFLHEVEEGSTRVGLFGERKDRAIRCLACHRKFRGYTPRKLRFHLLCDPVGKQAKCPASTPYVRQEILAAEAEAAAAAPLLPAPQQGDATHQVAAVALTDNGAAPLLPAPEPEQGQDQVAAGSTEALLVTDKEAAPPTSTAPPPVDASTEAQAPPLDNGHASAEVDNGDPATPSTPIRPVPAATVTDDNGDVAESSSKTAHVPHEE